MKHIGWLVVVGSSVVLGSLAYGQIRLPEDTRSDVQKIQQLHITDDALPVRSDYTNAVMLLNSDPFNTQGTSGVSDTHDDYIWIPKGAISDGSIWPEDIE